jgi:ABC-type transport system involved in cytochrome bd biosynthesis fused ATPase/permease subunit
MPGTRLSITEKKLKRWWDSTPDQPHACLSAITVKGSPGLRGISDLELVFKYPISVICGRNGAGKSTILALAALAFEPPTGCASYNAIKRTRKIKGHPEDVYY